ncbi:hypothetical protein BKA62DRAFT_691099 [Auriculariales sp. MPI-PUGE-AT-0066]|nr:hypothetical protein BKA62DRAFT_691099 [Auriculariales sp. MPI-PUGE-AT-0066]
MKAIDIEDRGYPGGHALNTSSRFESTSVPHFSATYNAMRRSFTATTDPCSHSQNLAPEIWLAVFELLPRGALRALRISHVCRYWRNIARSNPSLWTHIVVELGPWSRLGTKWRLRSDSRPFKHAPEHAPWLSRDAVSEIVRCLPEQFLDAWGSIADINLLKMVISLSESRPLSITLLLNRFVHRGFEKAIKSALLQCTARIEELNIFFGSWCQLQLLIANLLPLKNLKQLNACFPDDSCLYQTFRQKHDYRGSLLFNADSGPLPHISTLGFLSSANSCPATECLTIPALFSWYGEDPFSPSFCWRSVRRLAVSITDDIPVAAVASMFPEITHLTLTMRSWFKFDDPTDLRLGLDVYNPQLDVYPQRFHHLQHLVIHNAWMCHALALLPFFEHGRSQFRSYTVNYVGSDRVGPALLSPIRCSPIALIIHENIFFSTTLTATTTEGNIRELTVTQRRYRSAIKAHLATVMGFSELTRLSVTTETIWLLYHCLQNKVLSAVTHFTVDIFSDRFFNALNTELGYLDRTLPALQVFRYSLHAEARTNRGFIGYETMKQILSLLQTSSSATTLEIENLALPPDWTKPSDCNVHVVIL